VAVERPSRGRGSQFYMDPNEESIDVAHSEESDMEDSPSEETKEDAVEEEPTGEAEETGDEKPEESTEEPEEKTYELPDGRKVDGETLAKEWKENFYPDYTKKSQALADIEKGNINQEAPAKPYDDPDWQPKDYGEVINLAKQEVLQEIDSKEKAFADKQKEVEENISTQLEEIKTEDPDVDENVLFQHANKYGFRDLKLAHQNMKDMSDTVKKVQTKTAKDIAKRNDPVSVNPGAVGGDSDPGQFENALEYMRSIK